MVTRQQWHRPSATSPPPFSQITQVPTSKIPTSCPGQEKKMCPLGLFLDGVCCSHHLSSWQRPSCPGTKAASTISHLFQHHLQISLALNWFLYPMRECWALYREGLVSNTALLAHSSSAQSRTQHGPAQNYLQGWGSVSQTGLYVLNRGRGRPEPDLNTAARADTL